MAVVLGCCTKTCGVTLKGTAPYLGLAALSRLDILKPYTPVFYSENPRELRAVNALFRNPRTRRELDEIVGTNNSPHTIFGLRAKGLEIICELVSCTSRDGYPAVYGVYSLTAASIAMLSAFFYTHKEAIGAFV